MPATSVLLAVVTVALPYTPLARALGLAPLSGTALAALAVAHIVANEITKRRFPPDDLSGG